MVAFGAAMPDDAGLPIRDQLPWCPMTDADPRTAANLTDGHARAWRWELRCALLTAGLLQGAAVFVWKDVPTVGRTSLIEAVIVFLLVVTFFIQMTWTSQARMRSLVLSVTAAVVPAFCKYWTSIHWANADAPSALALLALASFFALPYLQILARHGRSPVRYEELYGRVVDNGLAVAVGLVTLGLYFALRSLWAELFDMLNLSEVEQFLESDGFTSVTDGMMWSVGLIAAREGFGMLGWLRRLAETLAGIMLPVVVAIGLSFFAALPFTGLDPVWREAGGSRLLLAIAIFSALFINGTYRDGSGPHPGWQRRLVEAGTAILLLAMTLAVYGTSLRILQHGLTPDRILLLASVVVAALIGLGYAFAALPIGNRWFQRIRRVNMLAFATIAVLSIGLASPLLDPVRLSAWDQYRRLVGGSTPAETFDYGYLWFRLGEAGKIRIAALETLNDHPDAKTIRRGIAEAKSFENYYAWAARAFEPDRLAVQEPERPSIAGPAATVTRSTGFNGTHQWDAHAVASIEGAATKIHWIDETFEWRVGRTVAVLVPLDYPLTIDYVENGTKRSARLAPGDVLRAEPGGIFTLRPTLASRILIVEEARSH